MGIATSIIQFSGSDTNDIFDPGATNLTPGVFYSDGDVGFVSAIKGYRWSCRVYPLGTTLMTVLEKYKGHSILCDTPLKHRHV